MENDPDMECFENNKLKFASNGEDIIDFSSPDEKTRKTYSWGTQRTFVYYVDLPSNLTCEHCIMQVIIKK